MLLAIRNLSRNKARTLMTMTGAGVGIALFVALMSISSNFEDQIKNITQTHRVDIAIQSKEAASPMASRIPPDVYTQIKEIHGVDEIALVLLGRFNVPWNPYLVVLGVSSPDMFLGNMSLVEGRIPIDGENEILIGFDVSRIGYGINERINLLHDKDFSVAGIYTSAVNLLNATVMLDLKTAQRLMNRNNDVSMVFARIKKGHSQNDVAASINQQMPSLSAAPTGEMAGQMHMIRVGKVSALIISFIAIIASCVMIINTLLMSIAEKTKEIGVLMAIGWSRAMIVKLVLAESFFICTAGMLMGNFAGHFFVWLFSYINPEGLGWYVTAAFHPGIFFQTIIIAMGLAMASGFYPALVATRMNPVKALRYE